MIDDKKPADMPATDLDEHALELSKELSKQLNKHRQLRCFVEGDNFNDDNESCLFSKYGSLETIDGNVFDICKLQKAIELYSKTPDRDNYNPVSLARQILLDCNVFNKEEYTKLEKQVEVMLFKELKKHIDTYIKNGNFDNDAIKYVYEAHGDGNQLQLEKFDGLVAAFLDKNDVYNDIESLASEILLTYGIEFCDEIDLESLGSGSDSDEKSFATKTNESNLREEFIENEMSLQFLNTDFYLLCIRNASSRYICLFTF